MNKENTVFKIFFDKRTDREKQLNKQFYEQEKGAHAWMKSIQHPNASDAMLCVNLAHLVNQDYRHNPEVKEYTLDQIHRHMINLAIETTNKCYKEGCVKIGTPVSSDNNTFDCQYDCVYKWQNEVTSLS